jgi:hypothetical protein
MDGCHSDAITVRFTLRSSADVRPYLKTNQSNISRKTALGSSILFCLYACFKGNEDQIKERVDERGVHVDNIVALLQRHPVGALLSSAIVRVNGAGIVGHVGDNSGEGITINRVSLVACIMFVEVGVDRNIQQVHLLGDGGFVHLGTFAHVLQEIVEDK